MQKNAQSKRQTGRGFFNELREKINMPTAYLDGFFKPELERVMDALKRLDDKIRSEITGKKIGTAEEPSIKTSAKDLLKSARTNFNRREYISGISDLGMFHKKMYDVTKDINTLLVDVNKIHNKFLFEGVDEDKINKLREHMDRKAGLITEPYFVKQAGIMDFFYNIGTKRGRGLAAYEKKYPKETKDLREWGTKLVDDADALLLNSIGYLKEMATARATRRPDEYIDIANKIKAEYDKFDNGPKGFRAYYNNVVAPFLKTKDEIEAREKAYAEEQAKKNLSTAPTTSPDAGKPGSVPAVVLPGQSAPQWTPGQPNWQTVNVPGATPSVKLPVSAPEQLAREEDVVGPIVDDTDGPPTEKSPAPVHIAHEAFYNSLEAMSCESPRILAGFISKYAKSIQENDMETAIKLFSIVKRLKG